MSHDTEGGIAFTPDIDSECKQWDPLLCLGLIVIKAEELLSAIWYSDGSGAHRLSVGLDSIPDEWAITSVTLRNGHVFISISRKEQRT